MQVERVRRLNEPREETALCETHECANCLYTIEGGGLSVGKRWLHLTCVDVYIENLERSRDAALVDAETARAALSQIPPMQVVWSNGAGWQPMQYGTTYTVTLDPAANGASGGGGVWTNATGAMSFQAFPSVTTAATYTPTLYTSTTTSGLVKSLGP